MKAALTDRAISALSPADTGKRYDVTDTVVPGFLVRVTDSGSKTYALYARFQPGAGPTRRIIGDVGAVTLKAARDIARDWRESIRRGVDPGEVLKQQAAYHRRERDAEKNTFAKVVEFYLAERVIGPDPEKPILRGADQVTRQFRHDLIPALGEKAITAITAGQVQDVIKAKAKTAPAMARNLFAAIRTMFKWVVHEKERFGVETSPCASISIGLIVGPTTKRKRTLTDDELRLYWRNALRLRYPFGPLYRLLVLASLRLNEAAGVHRDEFDWKKGVWVIPAERMKGRNGHAREHLVPITDEIAALIESLPKHNEGGFLFSTTAGVLPVVPGAKMKALLDARMLRSLKALRRMRGEPTDVRIPNWVNHDVRRTVRTNLSSLRTVSKETREAIMAHVKPGVEGVYDLYEYADEKREALTLWAALLRTITTEQMSDDLSRFVG
jgi:integrase